MEIAHIFLKLPNGKKCASLSSTICSILMFQECYILLFMNNIGDFARILLRLTTHQKAALCCILCFRAHPPMHNPDPAWIMHLFFFQAYSLIFFAPLLWLIKSPHLYPPRFFMGLGIFIHFMPFFSKKKQSRYVESSWCNRPDQLECETWRWTLNEKKEICSILTSLYDQNAAYFLCFVWILPFSFLSDSKEIHQLWIVIAQIVVPARRAMQELLSTCLPLEQILFTLLDLPMRKEQRNMLRDWHGIILESLWTLEWSSGIMPGSLPRLGWPRPSSRRFIEKEECCISCNIDMQHFPFICFIYQRQPSSCNQRTKEIYASGT